MEVDAWHCPPTHQRQRARHPKARREVFYAHDSKALRAVQCGVLVTKIVDVDA